MNRRRSVALMLVLFLGIVAPLTGQSQIPPTWVAQIVVADSEELEPAAEAIDLVVSYYLSVAPRITHVQLGKTDTLPADLASEARRYRLDTLIVIEVSSAGGTADEPLRVHTRFFDTAKSAVVESETAELDSEMVEDYDILHRVVSSRLSELIDFDSRWGLWRATNLGSRGVYDISIDGVRAGSNLSNPIASPTGVHVALIEQNRPFGRHILAEQEITISTGAVAGITFAIPALTDLERSAFEQIETRVRDQWDEDANEVENRIEEALTLLDGNSASSTVSRIAFRFNTLSADLAAGRRPTEFPDPNPYRETTTPRIAGSDTGVTDTTIATTGPSDTTAGDTDDRVTSGSLEPEAGVADTGTSGTGTAVTDSTSTGETSTDEAKPTEQENGDGATDTTEASSPADAKAVERRPAVVYRARETGLLGPVIWSSIGGVCASAAQIALDIGAGSQLFEADDWNRSVTGWGTAMDNDATIRGRLLVDYGGWYRPFALGAASAQAVSYVVNTALFPYRRLTLSSGGRVVYSLGMLVQFGGSALSVLARTFAIDAVITERSLEEVTEGGLSSNLWETYRSQYARATTVRVASYAAMGIGAMISATSAAASGTAERVISGPAQVILANLGSLAGSAAALGSYLSLLFRTEAEHRYDRYISSGLDTDYAAYRDSMNWYRYATLGSYGLYGGAGLSWLTAVLLAPSERTRAKQNADNRETAAQATTVTPYMHTATTRVTLGVRIETR